MKNRSLILPNYIELMDIIYITVLIFVVPVYPTKAKEKGGAVYARDTLRISVVLHKAVPPWWVQNPNIGLS